MPRIPLAGRTGGITILAKSRKNYLAQMPADAKIKDFLDMVSPSVIQFNVDHYLCGNTLPMRLGAAGISYRHG